MRSSIRRWTSLPALLSALLAAFQMGASLAQEKNPPAKADAAEAEKKSPAFIRIRRDDKETPLSMDTSVVTYVPADPAKPSVSVTLIGAVHVGDKAYYEALNKEFEQYDALLYELVAPEGTKIPKDRPAGATSAVGTMQLGMKDMLDLEFQLERIDYQKANFVHADMSPEEFGKTMEQRGESFTKMFFRMMGYGMAQQSKNPEKSNDLMMLRALFSKNRAQMMKVAMAEQFENMDDQIGAINGKEGSTILTERNRKALEVMDRELKAGKKKLGIFYGAAHLPDMEARLINDFGMKRSEERWLPAWSLVVSEAKKK